MKRIVLLAALLAIAAAAFPAYWFWPREVDFEAQGMKYRLGSPGAPEERPLKVSIRGKLYRNLKGDLTFKGTVGLEGEDIPVPEDQRTVKITKYKGLHSYWLVYSYIEDAKPYIFSMGQLFTDDDFGRIAIQLYEHEEGGGHWDAESGLMIAAPASNREEAVALSNELMRDMLAGVVLK
jgi:hypothetical protein